MQCVTHPKGSPPPRALQRLTAILPSSGNPQLVLYAFLDFRLTSRSVSRSSTDIPGGHYQVGNTCYPNEGLDVRTLEAFRFQS